MKLTNIVLSALMLTMAAGSVHAATTATATQTINVTFTVPSCNITVPSSYNLGPLTPGGAKDHSDFNITWTCQGNTPLKTGLTAGIVSGTADGDSKVRMMSGGQATGAALSLREKGTMQPIKLTGSGAKDYFCSDANAVAGVTRTCTLTPVTEVSRSGPFGLASATLRFEVGYP
ncbi:F18 fimbrial protein FedE [Citrobacter sp. A316]|uniref:F18 fimbrial protein FedE n=1 Tax=Citrobacter sp. A316 TaxID=1639132 RepID=UPI0009AC6ED8|nr:F18 fimbrial protein FedE [Citrobacter sp. A316]OPW88269.1 F18 fimbrial protein FedE [Citrobacter sp. A316]